jgi:hypothetical protein
MEDVKFNEKKHCYMKVVRDRHLFKVAIASGPGYISPVLEGSFVTVADAIAAIKKYLVPPPPAIPRNIERYPNRPVFIPKKRLKRPTSYITKMQRALAKEAKIDG